MGRLIKWFNIIIKKQKGANRWQKVVTVMAAMITFATTYALILPAITVEKNSTEEVGGMYLEQTAEQDELLEENALEPTGVSIAADMDNAVTFSYADDDLTATAVFSTDEEIPGDAELVVNLVDFESEEYADLSARAADLLDREFIYDVTTCSFYDYALVSDNVDVTPETGLVDIQIIFRNNTVQHIDDVVYAGRFVRPAEEADGLAALSAGEEDLPDDTITAGIADAADELVAVNVDESSVIEFDDGIITSLSLKGSDLARSDSIVGILAGNVNEEIKAAAAETDAEIPDDDESQEENASGSTQGDEPSSAEEVDPDSSAEDTQGAPREGAGTGTDAAPQVKTLKASGSDYSVVLTYDETSGIPAGAALTVSEIAQDSEEYQTYLKETKKAMGLAEEEALPRFAARFFDIKIMAGGKEFTPESGVSVEITYAEPLAEYSETEVNAVHFADEKAEAEVIEANTAEVRDNGKATVEFTAESFSVYGVIYTVDFHWEVDGKTYDYSIPGGGFVSFYDLIEVLGIEKDDPDTEIDEIRELVDCVDKIEFSEPEFVSVSKVENNTTVGAVKDSLHLECEYSTELTEEQIEEINAQAVKAGDWILLALKPFDTEECLTVTMKNGDIWTVVVTDAFEVTSFDQLDSGHSYILGHREGNSYYVLMPNGTTKPISTSEEVDRLGDEYRWTFYYVFTEKDRDEGMNYVYYLIRPVADKTQSLALYQTGISLLEPGANNIAVHPQYDENNEFLGYVMEGYDGEGGNDIYIGWNGTAYYTVQDLEHDYSGKESFPENGLAFPISILEQEPLTKYDYTVKTDCEDVMGTVSVAGTPIQTITKQVEDAEEGVTHTSYVCRTDDNQKNTFDISATARTRRDPNNVNRWLFDYFDLDGERVPSEYVQISNGGMTGTIRENTLTINNNGSVLTAHFVENSNYTMQDIDKQGTTFHSMQHWLEELQGRNVPLNPNGCSKTAEVYDYENRIYRVDLTAQSSLTTFDSTIDLAFVMDISKSMLFPATLSPYKENFDIYNINDNPGQLTGGPYYVIADDENTATVMTLFKSGNNWYVKDASKYVDNQSVNGDAYKLGDSHKPSWISNSTKYFLKSGDDWRTRYTIYKDDRVGTDRFDDLKDSMVATVNAMSNLLNLLKIVDESDQESDAVNPDVNIAYTTFHKNTPSQSGYGNMPHSTDYKFTSATTLKNTISSVMDGVIANTSGGTSTDRALQDAMKFDWDSNASTRYVVLITDGAPQRDGVGIADSVIEEYADTLKTNGTDNNLSDDVKLITIGLSMGNVDKGRRLLWKIADDIYGEHAFYAAEGDTLKDVLLHILRLIMNDAIVEGQVTDVVGEAFYPVDKATGRPLGPGARIDLDGNQVNDGYAGPVGIVQPDGKTIVWSGQEFTWEGWQGTVYVKAKEDLLGGNAVRTNEGDASIVAQGYKFNPGDDMIPIVETSSTNSHYTTSYTKPTPLVNVNELDLTKNSTEWTVYIGESVDPRQELQKLYESIEVEQVVTRATDTDEVPDGLPDCVSYITSRFAPGAEEEDRNYYPLEESISDQREAGAVGVRNVFLLKDLLKKIVPLAGTTYSWWDYSNNEVKLDEFFDAISTTDGIKIPYNVYGLDHQNPDGSNHNDNSYLEIKLTQSIAQNEPGLTDEPHVTNVTGSPVEKYTLTVMYHPDYDVLNRGQGGMSDDDFHTGTTTTVYQGHAAGRESSENVHTINVYAQPLDVLKTDDDSEDPQPLAGAKFALYRAAKSGETVTTDDLTSYDDSLTGNYYKMAEVVTGADGIARMVPVSSGMTAKQLLVPGETYYLVELEGPTVTETLPGGGTKQVKYEPDRTVKVVTVETQDGLYTDLENQIIPEKTYPFNWDQGTRILVNGEPVLVIARQETQEGAGNSSQQSIEITDGSFVSYAKAISFITAVKNIRNEMKIKVDKRWENQDNPPDHIEFQLYRVAHIDCTHTWGEWVVTEEPTCEGEGSRTRTCTKCDKVQTETMPALGHDYQITVQPATCEDDGITTYVCSRDSDHNYSETIQAKGHVEGPVVIENYDDPDYNHAGGYDEVVYCTVCGEELSRNHVTLAQLIKTTQIQYRIYDYWYNEYWSSRGYMYLGRTENTTSDEYVVGTPVTITWHDTNNYSDTNTWGGTAPVAKVYVNSTPSSESAGGGQKSYWGWNPPAYTNVTRTGTSGNYTYTATVNVTENMVVDICVGYYYNYWGFDFAGTKPSRSAPLSMSPAALQNGSRVYRGANTALAGVPSARGGDNSDPDDGNDPGDEDKEPVILTSEALQTLLGTYTKKENLTPGQDNVTYIEKVILNPDNTDDPYTVSVTEDDDWHWEKDDLPRFDENGNEYTYYIVETSPVTGYETTYLGQHDGLHNGDSVTITNRLLPIVLQILKYKKGTEIPVSGATFKLTRLVDGTNTIDTEASEIPVSSTDSYGRISFSGIMPGRYKLEEIGVPAGYILSEGPYYINVTQNDKDTIDDSASLSYISVSSNHLYIAENEPGAALPHTGGYGTNLFYLVGCIMTVIAGAGIVMKKRQKKAT